MIIKLKFIKIIKLKKTSMKMIIKTLKRKRTTIRKN